MRRDDYNMKFISKSHRHAEVILENDSQFTSDWEEVKMALRSIYDGDIIRKFNTHSRQKHKSISTVLNMLIKERLLALGWVSQPYIFQEPHMKTDKTWRLDFAKPGSIAIEVAYNHGEAVSWNLIKPVLASNINLMNRETVTQIGIIISATHSLKETGGFDGAVGTFEKYEQYLMPLHAQLNAPLLLLGLLPPRTFRIEHYQLHDRKKIYGRIKYIVRFRRKPDSRLDIVTLRASYRGRIYCFNKIKRDTVLLNSSYNLGHID